MTALRELHFTQNSRAAATKRDRFGMSTEILLSCAFASECFLFLRNYSWMIEISSWHAYFTAITKTPFSSFIKRFVELMQISLTEGDVQWTEFTPTRDSLQQGVIYTLFRFVEIRTIIILNGKSA